MFNKILHRKTQKIDFQNFEKLDFQKIQKKHHNQEIRPSNLFFLV